MSFENFPDIYVGLLIIAFTLFLIGTIFGSIFFKRVLNLSWVQSLVCIVFIILYLIMVDHLISFFITFQLQQPLIGDSNTLCDMINLNEKNRSESLISISNDMKALTDRIDLICKNQEELSKYISQSQYDDSDERIQSLLLTNLSDINPYKID